MGLCFVLIFMSISSSLLPFCTGQNYVFPGRTITANQSITSVGGIFALGFFSLGNSTRSRYYLGIWYKRIQELTVVWVANRESPMDSPGVFEIGTDGNLVVLDATRETVWSSNVKVPDSAMNTTMWVLKDDGNLVLSSGGTLLWQSFDYPSDTLLPGMKLGCNKKTGQQRQLTSWINNEDPKPGMFSLGIDPTGPLQILIWKEHDPISRSDVYGTSISKTWLSKLRPLAYYFTINSEGDDIFVTYSASERSVLLRVTLFPSGSIELLMWQEMNNKWLSMWQWPSTSCDFYGRCSPFSSCHQNGSENHCKCLTGFQPKFEQQWDRSNWTSGTCSRQKALRCDKDDGFLKSVNIKLPDHSKMLGNMSMEDCETRCLRNCSCTAYAYLNASEGTSSKCLNWYGDLMDLAQGFGGSNLYIRVHDPGWVGNDGSSDKLVRGNMRKVMIAVGVVSTGLLCIASAYFIWRKSFGKQDGIGERPTGISASIRSEVGKDESELEVFSFNRIVAATNGFCEENKLGEGGFGPVYKGNLANQEVAIKRLSKRSGQGFEEFINELKLIAKLQHTNLVRLLGCCVEGEENILVYEYLPNRSLDKFLFDPFEKASLDWSKRFLIIEGIVQGLLYIHKYSRLRVIHRDLKASNILLDEEMNPKISDFGMARIFGSDQTEADTKRVVGTYGYMSPEYALYGKFSEKSDAFSFGVMLLEIVTGKRNTEFLHTELPLTLQGWAWEMWNGNRGHELIDPSIRDTCENQDTALKCIHVGLLCVQESPADRPTMPLVVLMLSNHSPSLPSPKEPAFSSISFRKSRNVVSSSSSHNLLSSCSNNELTISLPEGR